MMARMTDGNLPPADLFPKWSHGWLRVTQGFQKGNRSPGDWAMSCCFPRHINGELDWKRASGHKSALIWDADIRNRDLNHDATIQTLI